MQAFNIDLTARSWAKQLEDAESLKTGAKLAVARQSVARHVGIAAGTLENIRRGRSKGLRGYVIERLRAAVVRQLEAEIMRLTHELEVARTRGVSNLSSEVLGATNALREARALIDAAK